MKPPVAVCNGVLAVCNAAPDRAAASVTRAACAIAVNHTRVRPFAHLAPATPAGTRAGPVLAPTLYGEAEVTRLSRVLVAVDLTGESLEAFERGLALARVHGASLYVLHAVPADRAYGWRAGARFTRMAELRARAGGAGVEIQTVEQHGDPAEIIVVHAAARRPDIVLLGTALREGGHEPAPIVERVLQKVGCPVLCVPGGPPAGEHGEPAPARTPAVRHVLFAVRDAESVAAGLKAIVRLTGTVDRVTLLHVLPDLVADRARWYAWRTLHGPDERARIRQARRELEMAIPPEVRASTQVGVRVLRGSARGVIMRVADHMNVDLLVLGMSRRPFIRLLGSTTTRLVREAARPVLVLPVQRPLTEGEEPVRSRLRAA